MFVLLLLLLFNTGRVRDWWFGVHGEEIIYFFIRHWESFLSNGGVWSYL